MRHRVPRRESGFSLIELMAAITIFGLIAVVSTQITDNSVDSAIDARRARDLRYLAEYRAEQIKTFADHFDDIFPEEDFEDLGDQFDGFTWSLDIRDVVVFGESGAEDAEYYFEAPDPDEEDATPAANTGASPTSPEELRELTLRVTAPSGDGPGDYIELVMLLPRVQ